MTDFQPTQSERARLDDTLRRNQRKGDILSFQLREVLRSLALIEEREDTLYVGWDAGSLRVALHNMKDAGWVCPDGQRPTRWHITDAGRDEHDGV